ELQGATSGQADGLWGYAQGGVYDSDRERFVVTQTSGHVTSGSNEVNEFIVVTGLFASPRPMDPTVELFAKQGVSWPTSGPNAGIPYANIHATGPIALVDIHNHYPTNVLPSTSGAQKLYPNTGQHYGCVCYIPAPYRLLWTSGGVPN